VVVELGSGSSYLQERIPDMITSDVVPGVAETVIDGRCLPFRDASVKAIMLTHVMHHIPDVEAFFREAQRVLVPGGVVSMIECAHTPLGRFFFSSIHPEPYLPDATAWQFDQQDQMLDSNQALSWILFRRDREQFEAKFPDFEVGEFSYLPWFGYLLSGGVNLRSLVWKPLAPAVIGFEWLLRPLDRFGAIHWHVCVRKGGHGS
jgi:SAM-dependent methyltransferase